jgi:3'(2'), 5'-bisphosphate nucleotidase
VVNHRTSKPTLSNLKPENLKLSELLIVAINAAEAASVKILEVYNSGDFQAEAKGDHSPLTLADKKGHNIIVELLKVTRLPMLSEEGKSIPYQDRKGWEYFWMVDPLDGTKEFIKRNGEFTVNIALIHKNRPVLGVVAVPVTGEVFYAAEGCGVWLKKDGIAKQLPKRLPVDLQQPGLRVVASRSHMSDDTQQFIDRLKEPTLVSKGSSLKFLLLVEGKADVYPRYAPTMEWDTAAAHAIVNACGMKVTQTGKETELMYNKEDLLNPWFLVK